MLECNLLLPLMYILYTLLLYYAQSGIFCQYKFRVYVLYHFFYEDNSVYTFISLLLCIFINSIFDYQYPASYPIELSCRQHPYLEGVRHFCIG